MKTSKILIMTLSSLFSSAYAGEVGIIGGANNWSPTFKNGSTTYATKGSFQTEFGLYYSMDLIPMLSLEVDGIYAKRKTEVSGNNNGAFVYTYENSAIQIPVIARVNILPKMLSVGLGAYYEIGTAGMTWSGTVAPNFLFSGTTYGSAGLKHNDFGLLGSLRFTLPLGPSVGLLVDGRYLMGLSEQVIDTSTGGSVKNKYIQVLAGVSVGI